MDSAAKPIAYRLIFNAIFNMKRAPRNKSN